MIMAVVASSVVSCSDSTQRGSGPESSDSEEVAPTPAIEGAATAEGSEPMAAVSPLALYSFRAEFTALGRADDYERALAQGGLDWEGVPPVENVSGRLSVDVDGSCVRIERRTDGEEFVLVWPEDQTDWNDAESLIVMSSFEVGDGANVTVVVEPLDRSSAYFGVAPKDQCVGELRLVLALRPSKDPALGDADVAPTATPG